MGQIGHPEQVFHRATCGCWALSDWAGLGLLCRFDARRRRPHKPRATTTKGRPKFQVSPPPDDVNELGMEVAALRTMYLLKASPDQGLLPDRNQFNGLGLLTFNPKAAEPPRERKRPTSKLSKSSGRSGSALT